MSKILIVSDIHIDDYAQRNPSERYRLHQSRVVAQNIIEAARREEAEYLAIAGDVIEKSVIRPYIQTEVKNFLDTLMRHFKSGWIIWGNHDLDTRNDDHGAGDSVLSVMLPQNLLYSDKKEVCMDGTRIGFYNFRYGDFDLSWINGKLDLLITHATINYSNDDNAFQGKCSILDESKFDLAICGDIHQPGNKGKYVSIGVPQKCKMGDNDRATGVIYDTVSKSWKHIDLDPRGRLMKFQYTPDRSKEGWDPITSTWSVYRSETGTTGVKIGNIVVPAWEEVNTLIETTIKTCGLESIHTTVNQNCTDLDSSMIDFMFTLKSLRCKNWRSIEEEEAYFEAGDRILITGKNGAGKTSFLSALKYAFLGNTSFKDFIQFGAKDCWTEVEFEYQGNNYRLRRGSGRTQGKDYGLWMNGELTDYSGKQQFTNDMPVRFPFLEYFELFFFDSDHNKLIGELSEESKSALISKFFKLDKIDALHGTAKKLYDRSDQDTKEWKKEITLKKSNLKMILEYLKTMKLPDTDKQSVLSQIQVMEEQERGARLWQDYVNSSNRLVYSIQESKRRLGELESKPAPDLKTMEQEIEDLKRKRQDISENQVSRLLKLDASRSTKETELSRITKEGLRLKTALDNLGEQGVCSSCHQVLADQTVFENHKNTLMKQLNDTRQEYTRVNQELQVIQEQCSNSKEELGRLNEELGRMDEQILGLSMKIGAEQNRLLDIDRTKVEIDGLEKQLGLITVPPQIVLSPDHSQRYSQANLDLRTWTEYEQRMAEKFMYESGITELEDKIRKASEVMDDIGNYLKVTSPTGKIYEEIMKKLADQFTDNTVKYSVSKYKSSRSGIVTEHLDLSVYYINKGNNVAYQAASSGQQTIMDVHFMSNLVTGLGLIVMDEFLKHLDAKNHDVCIDMIREMNIGCIMLSSHMEDIAKFNNKSCHMELNDAGSTIIKFS